LLPRACGRGGVATRSREGGTLTAGSQSRRESRGGCGDGDEDSQAAAIQAGRRRGQKANLSNSTLKGAAFTGVNVSTGNLTPEVGLKTATLSNVIWSKTARPDGTLRTNDGGTCGGHLQDPRKE
jgi:hypothetical protein